MDLYVADRKPVPIVDTDRKILWFGTRPSETNIYYLWRWGIRFGDHDPMLLVVMGKTYLWRRVFWRLYWRL